MRRPFFSKISPLNRPDSEIFRTPDPPTREESLSTLDAPTSSWQSALTELHAAGRRL
jgi:hypothetical protein